MSIDARSALGLLALRQMHGGGRKKLLAALELPEALAGADAQIALGRAEREIEQARELGIELLSAFDPRFPVRLSSIGSAPLLLWVRGNVGCLSERKLVAVVGTRQPSRFGQTATQVLTAAFAEAGFGIVSGLALGVDSLGHEQALEQRVPTIAFLGCGLDSVYPRSNRDLAGRIIAAGGALVSEQPLGEQASPRNLIARNRLQSGLGVLTLVVQTDVKGGTVHTARFAAEQGRPVFCPQPTGDHAKNAGVRLLLEQPAERLSELMPAFSGAKRLCAELGAEPLARAVTRETLDEMLACAQAQVDAGV